MEIGRLYTAGIASSSDVLLPTNGSGAAPFSEGRSPHRPQWRVYALFCVFGVSSWLTINASFIQLPILAKVLPEGWAIGSYLAVAIQLANLFPLAFMAYSAQRDGHSSTGSTVAGASIRTGESQGLASYNAAIVTILSVGILSTTLTALFWKSTLWGSSMVFLTLMFVNGGVDCTTSVLYWPFAAQFKESYVAALSVGEGLSGVASSLLGIVQSPGTDNRFSVTVFFLMMAVLMFISGVAFLMLWRAPFAQGERRSAQAGSNSSSNAGAGLMSGHQVRYHSPDTLQPTAARGTPAVSSLATTAPQGSGVTRSRSADSAQQAAQLEVTMDSPVIPRHVVVTHASPRPALLHGDVAARPVGCACLRLSAVSSWLLRDQMTALLVLAWASCLENGIIMSIRTYATLPFSHGSAVLLWTGILVTMVDPFAASLSTWPALRCYSLKTLCAVFSSGGAVIVALALSSPSPPLHSVPGAGVAVVGLFVITRCFVSYTRAMCVMSIQRRLLGSTTASLAASGARWTGVAIQGGALVGSVVMFFVVNYGGVFHAS